MKQLSVTFLLILAAIGLAYYGYEIFSHYRIAELIAAPPAPPPLPPGASETMEAEVGPIKVVIGESTPWESIIKLMVVTLGSYLGVKLINKYV